MITSNVRKAFGAMIALEIIESISQVNKWNNDGRLSFAKDIAYIRSKIDGGSLVTEFNLLEEYVQIYFTTSRTELLQFVKEKA